MRKSFLVFFFVVLIFPNCVFTIVQVGEDVIERIETPHPYNGGPGLVYERVFHWPEAGYISIHFSNFDLTPGDFVEISNPDGRFSYKYNARGKIVRGGQAILSEFWATHIPGDTAVVKLQSRKRRGGWGFAIDRWVHGYDRETIAFLLAGEDANFDAGTETICSSDDKVWAKCLNGTVMYEKARAVARLLMNGGTACTGWLLGSEGHLLTNNHCISNQNTADNTDYEFMAEGATCSTDCADWFACPGIVEATSGTLVKRNGSLDYSLILLPSNLTSQYGYLQFRDTLPSIGERIYIPQHPHAWGKQLAVDSDVDGGYCEVYSTTRTPCTGGPGDIGYYCDTAGGSSGSPVIAYDDQLVVALHHCANCPNRGVPIPAIIEHLGSLLPNDAIGAANPDQPPAPPVNPTAKTSQTTINLRWTDNSNNEDGFDIYRGPSDTSLSLIATVGANTSTYTDTGLTRKTTYYYKVCAFNTFGESCSNTISAKTK